MTVKSADKKPEKYVGPDGKTKIRMVPVDKEVVKSEKTFKEMRSKYSKRVNEYGGPPISRAEYLKQNPMKKVKPMGEAKDPEEYDKEGDMAKTQLKTMIDAAQELHDQLSDDENMPEWVQNKITKATDYIDSVRDYMKNNDDVNEETTEAVEIEELTAAEKKLVNQMYDKKGNLTPLGKKVMNHGKKPGDRGYTESLDEISKGMASRYIKKAQVSTADAAKSTERGYTDSRSPDRDIAKAGSNQAKRGIKTFINRNKGTSTAVDKLTGKAKVPAKEDTVSEISNYKMGQYVRKAAGDAAKKGAAGDTKKAQARVKGVSKAMDKMDKNKLFGRQ
ncbi:hypothetical protein N9Y60_05605 [Crocinitomicaceae bacterium]|nr:hypothetical protein [Crocinitomicaceae bacterium]